MYCSVPRLFVYLLLVGAGLFGFVCNAVAAYAQNAYVSVICDEALGVYAVNSGFYVLCPSETTGSLHVRVVALDPFRLDMPDTGFAEVAPGGSCSYCVSDESGSEDSYSGVIRVLKLAIKPDETNVCWKASQCTLRLTSDSNPGGKTYWTSRPAGIYGTGRSVTFNPQNLSPGVYVVTATSELASQCSDICVVRVSKVELVTPSGDPVGAPSDSGDGQNEFTYSTAMPGVLTMNLKARVTPASAARGIANACVFGVESIGDSVMSWRDANPAGCAKASDGTLIATVTFTGLPKSNSDFGRKTASITFGGILCDEKSYEVFFPKNAKNHPLGQADSPNWFYYWQQGNVCSIPAKAKYEFRPRSYGYWNKTNGLVLCDHAAQNDDTSRNVSARIYTTNWVYEIRHHPAFLADVNACSAGVAGEAYYVTNIVGKTKEFDCEFKIGGDGEGIGCVAMTVKHELGHMDMNEIWVGSEEIVDWHRQSEEDKIATYGYDSLEAAVARMLKMEKLFTYGDRDNRSGDSVPDGRERNGDGGVYSNDFDSDTFKLSELISDNYVDYGDNEVRMRKLETEDFSDMYHEDLDWANPGCQHKNKFGPRLNGGVK